MVHATETFRSWDLSFVLDHLQIGTKPSPSRDRRLAPCGAELYSLLLALTVHWSWSKLTVHLPMGDCETFSVEHAKRTP